jgi:Cys-rich protein (TIGR01571 family)
MEEKHSGVYKPAPSAVQVEVGTPQPAFDATHDPNGILVGAWSAELCGCFTDCVPNCCMVTFVPFISLAQIAHRINVARYSVVLITFLVLYLASLALAALSFAASFNSAQENTNSVLNSIYNSNNGFNSGFNNGYNNNVELKVSSSAVAFGSVSQVISFIVSLIYVLLIWQLRSKVRERFQIPGSCCLDYCCVWWCSCCTIAQMATHVKSYKPGSCDFGPPDMLPAYE